jgi:hypothetical protein
MFILSFSMSAKTALGDRCRVLRRVGGLPREEDFSDVWFFKRMSGGIDSPNAEMALGRINWGALSYTAATMLVSGQVFLHPTI